MSLRDRRVLDSTPVEYPTYSNAELEKFGAWLEKFREEKEVVVRMPRGSGLLYELLLSLRDEFKSGPAMIEKIYPVNMQEALTAFGAMKKRMLPYLHYAVIVTAKRPIPYELFWHKYNAYFAMKGKKEFAEDRQLADYEAMSQEAAVARSVEPVFLEDEPETKHRLTPQEVDEKFEPTF